MLSVEEQDMNREIETVRLLKELMKKYGIKHHHLSGDDNLNIDTLRKVLQFDKRYFGTCNSAERLQVFVERIGEVLLDKRKSLESDLDLLSKMKSPLFHDDGSSKA
jgi:hypothetical protein